MMPTKWKTHKSITSFKSDSRHRVYDAKRIRDEESALVHTFRGSIRWQRCRLQYASKNPTCHDPFHYHARDGLPALCQSVHHVIGLAECLRLGRLDDLGCTVANMRALCNACHNQVEGIFDRQGEDAAKRIFITVEEEQQIKSHGRTSEVTQQT